MWNPLHYAVYYNHLQIVKYIVNIGVNLGVTAYKPNAESEKDPTNSVSFSEDKILLLLIALGRNHLDILKYLLDDLSQFWSKTNFQNLIEKLPLDTDVKSLQIREIIFGSKTAHCFFENMGLKKEINGF